MTDFKVEDSFLDKFFKLLDKESFFNEEFNKEIKQIFYNRFEVYYCEICRNFLNLKKELFVESESKQTYSIKRNILKLIYEINDMLMKNQILTKSDKFYIFKPISLLKLWDNTTEDLDISTHSELLKFFIIKVLLKKNDYLKNYIRAFNELKHIFTSEPNLFEKSQIFIYYIGKLISIFIQRIDEIDDDFLISLLERSNRENYLKIKRILEGFGYPNSNNFRKISMNFGHLAKISEYFGEDQKM